MSRWTPDEIFEGYANHPRYRGIVHWQQRVPFRGVPGHLYFLRRRRPPGDADLAGVSHRSQNAEAALMRINDVYTIKLGSAGIAHASLHVPPRQDGIEEFELLAHTHPLELENAYERIARGPSRGDWSALESLSSRWGQRQSAIIVCRRGRVVASVPFRVEDADPLAAGRLWAPDRD
jgi:hypothetical protein